jgi:hypothetical protein
MGVNAQTINVSLSIPSTPFQNADVGAMAFGDIDNDGDKDLIITGKGGPIKTTLYINDGSGNFTAATGTPFVDVNDGTVGFADVNNDNFLDLLITGNTFAPTRTANLYINNGNGTFSIATPPFTPCNSGDFAFEDIDNDNDKDLIMTGLNASSTAFTKLYINNGAGFFSEVTTTPFEQLNSSSVAFIDVENDGDKDVVISGKFSSTNVYSTKIYTNNGSGIFTVATTSSLIGTSDGDIAVADSDNDGDMDILINGNSSVGLITKLYSNNGTGIFTEVVGTPFTGTQVGAVEFADFNNDGKKDVIVLGAKTSAPFAVAQIYQNQGNNNFVLSNDLIGTYLGSLAIADIDNDTDLDFIFGGTHLAVPVREPKLYKNNLVNLGISNFDNSNTINLYPNPTNNIVNFASSENIEKITIFNLLGQEVFSKEINSNEATIEMSNFANGTYVAKIASNGKSESVKLMKI